MSESHDIAYAPFVIGTRDARDSINRDGPRRGGPLQGWSREPTSQDPERGSGPRSTMDPLCDLAQECRRAGLCITRACLFLSFSPASYLHSQGCSRILSSGGFRWSWKFIQAGKVRRVGKNHDKSRTFNGMSQIIKMIKVTYDSEGFLRNYVKRILFWLTSNHINLLLFLIIVISFFKLQWYDWCN